MDTYNFHIHKSNKLNLNDDLELISNLCLEPEKYYQFSCSLTIIISDEDEKSIGQFLINGGSIRSALIGNGFKLETIIKDKNFNVYLNENNIYLKIQDNKFCIVVEPTHNCTNEIEGIADVKIASAILG